MSNNEEPMSAVEVEARKQAETWKAECIIEHGPDVMEKVTPETAFTAGFIVAFASAEMMDVSARIGKVLNFPKLFRVIDIANGEAAIVEAKDNKEALKLAQAWNAWTNNQKLEVNDMLRLGHGSRVHAFYEFGRPIADEHLAPTIDALTRMHGEAGVTLTEEAYAQIGQAIRYLRAIPTWPESRIPLKYQHNQSAPRCECGVEGRSIQVPYMRECMSCFRLLPEEPRAKSARLIEEIRALMLQNTHNECTCYSDPDGTCVWCNTATAIDKRMAQLGYED